ncbi:MAG: hypothetical protein ACK4FB_12860 [Brevundimonas sp.]|uniref:hypothetical protein n=1 Tax=Brevundimonas sp. TaxID=1871086 RepID=UPI003918B520
MLRIPLLAALTLAVAAPAVAQDAVDDLFANPRPAQERPQQQPVPAEPAPVQATTAVEKPEYDPEVEETQRLNAAVDAYNQSVRQTNMAAQSEYQQGLQDHAEWVARLAREHQAEQDAYEAELVRQRQQHEAALAEWRRRVEACQRGVIAACDPATIR